MSVNNDHISALERLAKLRADGTLTDQEYDAQKAKLLSGRQAGTAVPAYRRLWLVVVLTCLLFTFPLAMVILASGPVYKNGKYGLTPISRGARLTYAGLLSLWLAALAVKTATVPNYWSTDEATTGASGDTTVPQVAAGRPATNTASTTTTTKPNVENVPAATASAGEVISDNDIKDICYAASDKDSEYLDKAAAALVGKTIQLTQIAASYTSTTHLIDSGDTSRIGATELPIEALVDVSDIKVPEGLQKGGRFVVTGKIQDGVLWGNVVEGCFLKIKATSVVLSGF